MSFGTTGESLGKHQYLQDKPQVAAAKRLHGSPHPVDKYSSWGCCTVIKEAQKEVRRRLLARFGAYCLPIKIIACSVDLQSHTRQGLLTQKATLWEPSWSAIHRAEEGYWVCKAMAFPVVMYRCESWTLKKAEQQKLILLNCSAGGDS